MVRQRIINDMWVMDPAILPCKSCGRPPTTVQFHCGQDITSPKEVNKVVYKYSYICLNKNCGNQMTDDEALEQWNKNNANINCEITAVSMKEQEEKLRQEHIDLMVKL